MDDDIVVDAVHIAFAGYLAAVAILGATIKAAEAQGRVVTLGPAVADAKVFAGYPVPETISVEQSA